MTVSYLVVPQWQGSGSARAMRLVDGAQYISGDLPSSRSSQVDIPLEAGDDLGSGVARLSSITAVRDAQLKLLSNIPHGPGEWTLTVGGDRGVELASVGAVTALAAAATSAQQGDVALIWFSAHPALHSPESSRSGAFQSMVLRTLLGDGDARLVPQRPIATGNVILVGARAFDDAEDAYARESGLQVLPPAEITPERLIDAVGSTAASTIYIHVDLDVLDPADIAGVGEPEPFGLSAVAVVELIKALTQRFTVVGAGVTGFAPASTEQALDDQPTILRIIGALTH